MNELGWFATGFGIGVLPASWLVFVGGYRLLARRVRLLDEEAATVEREKRRAAMNSERTEAVREGAGAPAKLGNLFSIRPKKNRQNA